MVARLVACAAAIVLLAAPASGRDACQAWPGEPSPLPTSTDSDAALARWAQLRSLELRELAEKSAQDAVTVDRLQRHADCLAPLREPPPEAPVPRARLDVRVHRPQLGIVGRGSAVVEAESVAAALAQLTEPIPIARVEAPPPRVPRVEPPPSIAQTIEVPATRDEETPSTARLEPDPVALVGAAARPTEPAPVVSAAVAPIATESAPVVAARPRPVVIEGVPEPAGSQPAAPVEAIDENALASKAPAAVSAPPPPEARGQNWVTAAEASVAAARFEEALERAAEGRAALAADPSPASRLALAELEVVSGTAALALGRDAVAAEHFARARTLEPGLLLDSRRYSPKVVRAFDASEETP